MEVDVRIKEINESNYKRFLQMFGIKKITAFAALAALFVAGCDDDSGWDNELRHVKTELGGCIMPYEKGDPVTVTVSARAVNVLVGYDGLWCGSSFKTRTETVDGVLYMYIINDTDYSRGTAACGCYYTFDFVFEARGTVNQPYKILMITTVIPEELADYLSEEVVVSEGIIAVNETE
jgi:hypothetical protein